MTLVQLGCWVAEVIAQSGESLFELKTGGGGEVGGVGGGRGGEEDEGRDEGDDLGSVVGVGEGGAGFPGSLIVEE